MNDPYYFLDWDETCMKTKALKEKLFELLGSIFSYSEVESSYKEIRGDGYNPEKHFQYLLQKSPHTPEEVEKLESDYAEKSTEFFSQLDELLYPDAQEFIESHRGQGKVVILTFGNEEYQHQKIEGSGYGDLEVIVCSSEEKVGPLNKWLEAHGEDPAKVEFVFVDDNPHHVARLREAFPGAKTFLLQRDHTGELQEGSITSFADLQEAVQELSREEAYSPELILR